MTTAELLEIIARAEREGWTELDLWRNAIGDAGAAALAAATGLGALTWMGLGGNDIGDAGAAALAAATGLTALETLDLGGNRIGDAGAMALRARWGGIVRL